MSDAVSRVGDDRGAELVGPPALANQADASLDARDVKIAAKALAPGEWSVFLRRGFDVHRDVIQRPLI